MTNEEIIAVLSLDHPYPIKVVEHTLPLNLTENTHACKVLMWCPREFKHGTPFWLVAFGGRGPTKEQARKALLDNIMRKYYYPNFPITARAL